MDDSSSSSVRIEKLNDSNYHAWKRKIQLVLALRDLDEYIDSDRPAGEKEQKAWDRGDRKAQAVIGLALSDEHLEHVAQASTAKEMWKAITNVFERHTLLNKLAARRKFYTVTMEEGEKVLTYINRVQHLASVLKSMKVDVDDKEVAMAILNGLPSSYDNLIVALDALGNEDKLFSVDLVKSRLLQEEQRASMRESGEHSGTALFNNSRTNRNVQSIQAYHCDNCGHDGHTKDKCWGKDVNGRRPKPPPGYVSNREKRNGRVTNSAFVGQASSQSENEAEFTCLMSSFESTAVQDTIEIKESEYQVTTCLMTKLSKSKKAGRCSSCSSWIIDSGCTCHMTYDRSLFVSYTPLSNATVEMGTTAKTKVEGRGDVFITLNLNGEPRKCLLKDVLYVPDFEYNLISVSTMDKRGMHSTFGGGKCRLSCKGETLATGTLGGSLYYLDVMKPDDAVVHSANVATMTRWHERFAHVNTQGIASMASNNVVKGLNVKKERESGICESCVIGKCPRSPIPKQRTSGRTKGMLDLVHSDVCGPLQVQSMGGAKYFVTFIDDRSEWATVYPMRRKSETLDKYKMFQRMAETHTGRKVRIVRSDRGGEYLSNEYDDHLDKHGTQRQLTVTETPQQNGVAERMNRTLMDLVRSMLHAKKVPKQFWAEALATAVYVRNRVTSRAIEKNTTPHHVWHDDAPEVSHLRVFGCRCWYKVPSSKVKKLDARAREALFLGYAESSKAYNVWDDDLSKVIISRDVTFDESNVPKLKYIRRIPGKYVDFTVGDEEVVSLELEPHEEPSSSAVPGSETPALGVESSENTTTSAESSEINDNDDANEEFDDPDTTETENNQATPAASTTVTPAPDAPAPLRRSTREHKKPSKWWSSYLSICLVSMTLFSNHIYL